LKARGNGFGHLRPMALKGFAPGRYVLRVEARGLTDDGGSASREPELTIR
jgi:hypothetical protein